MKMTEQEYKELIAHFEFIEDKVEACYKRERLRESWKTSKKNIRNI